MLGPERQLTETELDELREYELAPMDVTLPLLLTIQWSMRDKMGLDICETSFGMIDPDISEHFTAMYDGSRDLCYINRDTVMDEETYAAELLAVLVRFGVINLAHLTGEEAGPFSEMARNLDGYGTIATQVMATTYTLAHYGIDHTQQMEANITVLHERFNIDMTAPSMLALGLGQNIIDMLERFEKERADGLGS